MKCENTIEPSAQIYRNARSSVSASQERVKKESRMLLWKDGYEHTIGGATLLQYTVYTLHRHTHKYTVKLIFLAKLPFLLVIRAFSISSVSVSENRIYHNTLMHGTSCKQYICAKKTRKLYKLMKKSDNIV